LVTTLLVLALLAALPALGRAQPEGGAEFAVAAAKAQRLQLAVARLALERGGNEVKALANELLLDQQRALADLEARLERLGRATRLPREPDRAALAALAANADESFDAAYLAWQLVAQQRLVDLFSWYLVEGADPELRAYAAATVPILQHHLSATQTLAGRRRREGIDG
jgi:putative membrane protein